MNAFTSPCIDPRTGIIHFYLLMLHLIGHDHMDPALSLMLSYCALETERMYGQGFRDTLSWFNPQTRQLQTGGGVLFGLSREVGEWAFLSPLYIKLATRPDRLWICYRNGAIEIVARSSQKPADDVLWRLQKWLSAGGNAQRRRIVVYVAAVDATRARASRWMLRPGPMRRPNLLLKARLTRGARQNESRLPIAGRCCC